MFSDRTNSLLLDGAAICAGLAPASIAFGRAWLGILLGLCLILMLIAGNPKQVWSDLRPYLSKGLLSLLGITVIATSINLPFSLRVDLSWEAWLRSWLLLGAVGFLIYALRHHLSTVLKTIGLSVFVVYILGLLSVLHISKPLLSGLLLTVPLCFLYIEGQYSKHWLGLSLLNVPLYIACTLDASAKASLAGLILILLSSLFFWGLTKLRALKAILLTISLLSVVTIALTWWLPDQLNASSTVNAEAAPFPIWLIDFHRQLIWMFSFDLFQLSPWVGFGINASNYHPMAQTDVVGHFGSIYAGLPNISTAPVFPAHAHNWIIEILLDSGIIGLVPVLICVILIFFYAIRQYWYSPNNALLIFIAINVGYWGTGLLNFSFWSVWWQTLYFLCAAISLIHFLNTRKMGNDV